jgi:hypothetical protein
MVKWTPKKKFKNILDKKANNFKKKKLANCAQKMSLFKAQHIK